MTTPQQIRELKKEEGKELEKYQADVARINDEFQQKTAVNEQVRKKDIRAALYRFRDSISGGKDVG